MNHKPRSRNARLRWLVLATVALAGCVTPPGDDAQIRRLIQDRAAAIARADATTLYRLHDIDFRAVCSLRQFQAMPLPTAAPVRAVRDISVRSVRGSALVTVETADGLRDTRQQLVKDAGRWYLYDDPAPCTLAGRVSEEQGAPTLAPLHA